MNRLRNITGAGIVGLAGIVGGCGMGAYSKDQRAGYMWDSIAAGIWQAEVAKEGRSEVNQTVNVYGDSGNSQNQKIYPYNIHNERKIVDGVLYDCYFYSTDRGTSKWTVPVGSVKYPRTIVDKIEGMVITWHSPDNWVVKPIEN